MKRLMIAIGFLLLVEDCRAAVAAELGNFFACAELVFFGSCATPAPSTAAPAYIKEAPDTPKPSQGSASPFPAKPPQLEESMWAEPVRGADGQLRVYLPPKSVRDFLEKPTRENAREYLAWNQARLRQIDEAVNVMRDVAAEQSVISAKDSIALGAAPSATNPRVGRAASQLASSSLGPGLGKSQPGRARAEAAARQISIVYAFATWCPYSRQQTPIINQLAAHVPVRGVVFDSKPEDTQALQPSLAFPIVQGDADLRQRLGVRSYPTIFFFEGSRLHHVARGLQPPDRLLSMIDALAGRRPVPLSDSNAHPAGDTCQLRP
jgi:thiol-disulfide isomerase/thioredoxin